MKLTPDREAAPVILDGNVSLLGESVTQHAYARQRVTFCTQSLNTIAIATTTSTSMKTTTRVPTDSRV